MSDLDLNILLEKTFKKGDLIIGDKVKNPIDILRKVSRAIGVPLSIFGVFLTKLIIKRQIDKGLTSKYQSWYKEVIKDFKKVQPSLKEIPFYVIKSNEVNAFCVADSFVVFTSKILEKSDATKKFILGHELTHAIDKHVFEHAFMNTLIKFPKYVVYITLAVSLFAGAEGLSTIIGLPGLGTLLATVSSFKLLFVLYAFILIVIDAAWSRGLEKEADLSSINLIYAAYGKQFPFTQVFDEFGRMFKGGDKIGHKFMKTHPLTSERLSYMRDHLKTLSIEENHIRNYILENTFILEGMDITLKVKGVNKLPTGSNSLRLSYNSDLSKEEESDMNKVWGAYTELLPEILKGNDAYNINPDSVIKRIPKSIIIIKTIKDNYLRKSVLKEVKDFIDYLKMLSVKYKGRKIQLVVWG